jgi:hypothetical protein
VIFFVAFGEWLLLVKYSRWFPSKRPEVHFWNILPHSRNHRNSVRLCFVSALHNIDLLPPDQNARGAAWCGWGSRGTVDRKPYPQRELGREDRLWSQRSCNECPIFKYVIALPFCQPTLYN